MMIMGMTLTARKTAEKPMYEKGSVAVITANMYPTSMVTETATAIPEG